MIKTGYASDFSKKHPRLPDSGTVILITRGMPFNWLDYDEHIRVLSPQRKTKNNWLKSKQTEKDWKIYLDEFYPQMKTSEAISAMKALSERVRKGETITLICYCKPEVHCHRYIIKNLIESL